MRASGWSNDRVATLVEVHPVTISRWIGGKTTPSRETSDRIADALGVDREVLWSGDRGARPLAVREEGPVMYGRLPPAAYERVYGYLTRMAAAGIPPEEVDDAERLFTQANYSKLYAGGRRDLTEAELVIDIDATWAAIREVYRLKSGREL